LRPLSHTPQRSRPEDHRRQRENNDDLHVSDSGYRGFTLAAMGMWHASERDLVSRAPSVLGVADHTGWAYVVSVSARDRRPFVVTRRRVALIDRGLPTQPYEHETMAMRADEAQALVANVRKSIAANTDRALQLIVEELAREHPVTALAIRKPPFPRLPARVAAVHASHRLMCSADGMLFCLAICRAAERLGLDVQLCRRGDEVELAATALGTSPDAVEEFVSRAGRPAGPPWSVEHRRAYAAGIAALAPHVPRLTIE
jgi:hypothetical protein